MMKLHRHICNGDPKLLRGDAEIQTEECGSYGKTQQSRGPTLFLQDTQAFSGSRHARLATLHNA